MTGPADGAARDSRVRALAAEIAETRRDGIKALLREANLPQPGFIWDPPADTLPAPSLVALRTAWDAARGAAALPGLAALARAVPADTAADCLWVDLGPGALELSTRDVGARVAALGGEGWRDDAAAPELGLLLRAVKLAAGLRRKAIFMFHGAPARDGRNASWARLTLPFAIEDDGPAAGFLVGAVTMESSPLTFADIFVLRAGLGGRS
jgi:hypothetical protein